MPRIPIRVEPYSSPAKQHRHYKCKRDQVLRALGKAAYINGSQFAILLVSARGDVETYASDALQDHLDDWFMRSGVADQARKLTLDNVPEQRNAPPTSFTAEDLLDDAPEPLSDQITPNIERMGNDPFLESWSTLAQKSSQVAPSHDWAKLMKRSDATEDSPSLSDSSASIAHSQVGIMPQMSTPLRPPLRSRTGSSSRVAANAHQPHHTIVLKDEKERTSFLEMRFGQLQQVMCKMIAKEWIKVIEPKKQTRFPYNKGEEARPSWWPKDVRHKEPDHLMKPERHALLLAMLRSNQARIARLQLATAEVVVQIKSGRVSLLMDIYRVAREEENLRDQNLDSNTPITVGVSTLEGWNGEADPIGDISSTMETPSTSHFREEPSTAMSGPPSASDQRKRLRYEKHALETPDRAGNIHASWTPMSHSYDPPENLRGFSQISPSHPLPQSTMSVRTMPAMDAQQANSIRSSFEASDLSSYSPLNSRSGMSSTTPGPSSMPTSAPHGPMVPSPVANRSGLSASYPPNEHNMHPNLNVNFPPHNTASQATKSGQSVPSQVAHTPETWHMLQSQSQSPGFRADQPIPAPIAMPPQRDGDHRMSWSLGYPSSSMCATNASPQSSWTIPESPLYRTPIPGVGMNAGHNEVRFSPSFDVSFSNSGPMTPSNLSMQMQSMQPNVQSTDGSGFVYHPTSGSKSPAMLGGNLPAVGHTGSGQMPAYGVKMEPKPNIRYSNIDEWSCQ
ncbi:hypothetical protein MPSI1_000561 [Malassezia psittaci]|uniref:Subtelomeric hrmA-associated cluster protein AFUB-079030/YDR124W-like helical bundle domain-containing protein n=1 Tax=Malassezia psittaci TaxID=1821823 RepID=A0AAF0JD26_9BASI|nr:hypothetical protein MPSI1_000561 [Malassezia psittaci]